MDEKIISMFGMSLEGLLNRIVEQSEHAQKEVGARYEVCDTKGHQEPGEERCGYCFRRNEYTTPLVDAILESRSDIPFPFLPLDAAWLQDKRRFEIEAQKFEDFMYACSEIYKTEINSE